MKNCGGEIPSKKEELLKVPGVGEYTAGAILSIAFNQPEPAVDGNVIRVLSRLQTVYQTKTQMSFLNWCKRTTSELVAHASPSDYTQGIMELGAVVCTPQSPSCSSCPLRVWVVGELSLIHICRGDNTNNFSTGTHFTDSSSKSGKYAWTMECDTWNTNNNAFKILL